MTKAQETKTKQYLSMLTNFNKNELEDFSKRWQHSKHDIDSEVWEFVQRGIDLTYSRFDDMVSPIAVSSDGISSS